MIYQGHSVQQIDTHVRVLLGTTSQNPTHRPQPAIGVHTSILDLRGGISINELVVIDGLRHRSSGMALLEPQLQGDDAYTLYHVVGAVMSAGANVQPFFFFGNTDTVHAALTGVELERHWPLIGRQNGRGGCSIDQVVAMPFQVEGARFVAGVAFYNATSSSISTLVTGYMSVDRLSDPPISLIDARIS